MTTSRIITLTRLAVTLGAIGYLWAAYCTFPLNPWNDIRLAPAFALQLGYNPYPSIDAGPLFTWIYPPVDLFINLPATLATTAARAIETAFFINTLTILAPFTFIFFSSVELRARGRSACALSLATAAMLVPFEDYSVHVADHSATALGLLSCWCLARDVQPQRARLIAASALCALAAWSKQIAIALAVAQFFFLLIATGRTAAFFYAGCTLLFGLGALAVFTAIFGFDNLWLNLVLIPSQLPWAIELAPRISFRKWELLGQVAVPTLVLVEVWRRGLWPSRDTESGRFFQLTVLSAAVMLPGGIMAFAKIGGDINSLHLWQYLLPSMMLRWRVRDWASGGGALLRLGSVVALALALNLRHLNLAATLTPALHFEAAQRLTNAYPQMLWFPQNPVVNYFADGKLWHTEDGVFTRTMAGYGIREADFRRHLPPALKAVVYPAGVNSPVAMSLLPEYNQLLRLPQWSLHLRAPPTGPQP